MTTTWIHNNTTRSREIHDIHTEARDTAGPSPHVNAPPTRRERTPTQGGARRRCYPLPPRRRGGRRPTPRAAPSPRTPRAAPARRQAAGATPRHTAQRQRTHFSPHTLHGRAPASWPRCPPRCPYHWNIITVMTASCIHAQRTAREECYSFASCSASSSELQQTHSHIGQAHRIGARM